MRWPRSVGDSAAAGRREAIQRYGRELAEARKLDIDAPWFTDLLEAIGQPKGNKVATEH